MPFMVACTSPITSRDVRGMYFADRRSGVRRNPRGRGVLRQVETNERGRPPTWDRLQIKESIDSCTDTRYDPVVSPRRGDTMPMKNPPHPGRSIRENCLDPLGLSVTEAARVLGVARHTLSRVLSGHVAISPDLPIRLEKAGLSSADFWLRRQITYDLAQARKGEDRIRVERYQPLTTAWRSPPICDFPTLERTGPRRLRQAGAVGVILYPC